jgi:iron(III) transport system substrate-binding protein
MKLVRFRAPLTMLALAVALLVTAACSPVAAPADDSAAASDTEAVVAPVVVYSGRNENLVGPLLQSYGESSGAGIEVRYGGTSEMAATILEEGDNSPADVFFGQDAGALGALARAGRCIELPEAVTEQVNARFVSPDNRWVGLSGRGRLRAHR